MDLDLQPFDLPLALQNTVMLVREQALRHGLQLGLHVGERVGEVVGDERKIKQPCRS